MSTVILACGSLRRYVEAAQSKMGTDFSVVYADNSLHSEPEKMNARLKELLRELPEDVDTVLVAMGYCGGSWDKVPHRQKLVVPCVDDCVTLLLHTGDERCPNKKEAGHMYICDKTSDDDNFSIPAIRRKVFAEHGEYNGDMIFKSWFGMYHDLDIIDTGMYDCYDEEFVTYAQESADLIFADLNFVEGSNYLLEKLVAGVWDEQFVVKAPEETMDLFDFAP